jgi:hypothetical protein
MTQEQLRMQMLAGIITESQYKNMLNENMTFPEWYDSFIQQLSVKTDIDPKKLKFKMVDPHLMGISSWKLSPKINSEDFSKATKSVLSQNEFSKKALPMWMDNLDVNAKLAKKLPELEDYIYDDEYFWIYIK